MTLHMPNFRGKRALVLHAHDSNCDALVRQLERLGAYVSVRWPVEGVSADGIDVIFFDSDNGFDGLFAWPPGRPPVPLIALLGSEAPGRIEWTLAQEPAAYLFKPIASTGVFSALSIAHHNYAQRRAGEDAMRRLEDKLRTRVTVLRAAAVIMKRYQTDDATALKMLRAESMRRRATLDAVSGLVLEGKWLPCQPERRKSGAAGTIRRVP